MTREATQGSGFSERMRGYDQFISLLFCVLQIIYVSYIHLCCFICSHEFILYVLSYYNILCLFVLILQSYCLCCYLFIFSCSIIIHVPCLYAYYIYMIHMLYVLMIHIVMDIFDIMISMFNHLLYVIIIMLIYEIKMIWKMPIFLTHYTSVLYNVYIVVARQREWKNTPGELFRRVCCQWFLKPFVKNMNGSYDTVHSFSGMVH
jgi:hypothetical protein